MLESLRKSPTRVDIFTFMQRLPDTAPKYAYPMEWDNLAVLGISTFEDWWTNNLDSRHGIRRNKPRRKESSSARFPLTRLSRKESWKSTTKARSAKGDDSRITAKASIEIRQMSGTFLDTSIFIGAFLDEKLIGFIKLTSDDRNAGGDDAHRVDDPAPG